MGEFGSAGHDPEGVGALLDVAELAALRVHLAMKHLEQVVESINFTDDPIGRDFRRLVHQERDNMIAEANDVQDGMQKFFDQTEDAMRLQRETDQQNAERFHDDSRNR